MAISRKVLILIVVVLFSLNYFWFGSPGFSASTLFFVLLSLLFNFLTKRNMFFFIIIIYFYVWFLWGNLTYNIYSTIWKVDGDLILVNYIFSVFLFTFSLLGFIFVKNQELLYQRSQFGLNFDFSMKKAIFVSKFFIFVHLVFFLPNVSFGIHENYSDFSQNIALRIPFISRLIYIYPIFLILSYYRYIDGKLTLFNFLLSVLFSAFVITLTGSRFLLMTTLISLFFIHLISFKRQQREIDKKLLSYGFIFFILIYFLIPVLRTNIRSESNQFQFSNNYFVIFTKFGGEFRDGVWSTYSLSEYDKNLVSEHYLSTLFYPLFPKPIISALGLDYDVVFEKTSSVIMASSIDVDVKGIRIGGILELFYWKGILGVILGSCVLFFLTNLAINRIYLINSISSTIFFSFFLILPFYFCFAQSNLLLTPLFSFYLFFILIYYLSKYGNEKNIIYKS